MMRVCVTGSDGYLGSLLAPKLLERGYEVVGLDTGFYKEGTLYRSTLLCSGQRRLLRFVQRRHMHILL